MRMLLLLMITSGLVLAVTGGQAQTVPPQYADTLAKLKAATPEQRAQMQTDLMNQKLGLSPDQSRKVSAINLEYARRIEPILRSDESRFSKYHKVKPLLDEKDGKLKAVFTGEQWKKYGEVKQEMMAQARKAMS